MSKPVLLDLFCGAGGAAVGYQRAGFIVFGVDIMPQSRWPIPFGFFQLDARHLFSGEVSVPPFDAVHASPPCQSYCAYTRSGDVNFYGDYIEATRRYARQSGRPYVIENVPGAPLRQTIMLCGSMFGLDVQRHRVFESNVALTAPSCDHAAQSSRFPSASNRTNLRRTVEVGAGRSPLRVQQAAMGIDWMTKRELSEAIPPVYTEHIGKQLYLELSNRGSR